ncbi:YjdF family protein [Apilactobacillus timberlakei]|uniref:DUF2992 family protein n=1 Tax=Apilactobacillus timberlakei TaxID=2008380 RepID=A0ABY2YXC9_9LACO|nr:YjdF family protein [Apilactobacillus timberlakei]TPR13305.1 DUF2992 family protein [Apilactobacillus timberlakei]TPR14350.1 DUF2992 family protein [Apilactobacillus timberlakei]TPR16603.1 DUF2992 family protein [Apilactobacillus timberlakei]TPR19298.1 DUF2992 family protein [Apilactobacillus timberlakei]
MQNFVQNKTLVIFDNPFYKIIVERNYNDNYEVAQMTLGTSEPKMPLIEHLILYNWDKFNFYVQKDSCINKYSKRINPKRLQRMSKKAVKKGISTKAQNAIKAQIHAKKKSIKSNKRFYIKKHKQNVFNIKQKKKIQKHNGH